MIYLSPSPQRSSRRARAAAHRAMAMSALASNCSETVRYRRYHAHMRKTAALAQAADLEGTDAPWEVES
ncbi:hypothetical protein SAMN04488129_1024 [Halomonas daqiaonensis]|uniref:Uncharacterized protein n=1 Tax=Halomonas daqiaonensis TaxID=650850 RepID=A0A1H7GK02_9GAMM|nr:hypothetical protein SAMN04488129_1024 [Halomonas daqiaonensis]